MVILLFTLFATGSLCGALLAAPRPLSPRVSRRAVIRMGGATLKGLLFDCDGVLADTEPDGHRVAFNAAFKEQGLAAEWSVEKYGELLETGGGKERMTKYFNDEGWPAGYSDTSKQKELVKTLHLRKTELFNKLIDDGAIPLRPGVLSLIDEALAARVTVAVCSTSSEQAVKNLVAKKMGAARAARIPVYAGDMVAKKKPAPDVYLMAAKELGLSPAQCVVVEDSTIGLAAAKAAGMVCLVTKSSYAAREDFTKADRVVADLSQGNVDLDSLRELLEDDCV